ncbi:MAG TPA: MmcQ/YjbR family DNA-binding protein [Gemmatimonadaceae bacterium]|nr:MmcQ/YjbR family DNA-binding protein [Gemmatimonadaceae bacterium]
MPPSPLRRVRAICLAFPHAHEVEAWGEPTWRVNNKLFAMFASAGTHHGDGTPSVWVKSTPMNQQFMIRDKPKRYFAPPYVGPSGWIGVRLDGRVSWREVEMVLRDGYELIAPKRASDRARPSGRGPASRRRRSPRSA